MFKSNNPYIPKSKEKDDYYNAKILLNNSKVLSLVFSLFLAISYVSPFLLYSVLNNTIIIILLIASFIIFLSLFFLPLFLKTKRKYLEIIISIFFIFNLGFFLGLLSEYLRNLIIELTNSYDGYILIILTSSMVLSIVIISTLEYIISPYIRNFFFVMLIGYSVIFIIEFVSIFTLSRNVYGFDLMKNLLSGAFISLYFSFMLTIYYENIKCIIDDGIDKKDLVKLALSPITMIIWLPVDFLRIVIFSFKKQK